MSCLVVPFAIALAALGLSAPLASYQVSPLEQQYNSATNERSVSFQADRPIHLVDEGDVISYSFMASCQGNPAWRGMCLSWWAFSSARRST